MKLLLYGINFSPELTGVGKYTGEMAEWFADHGHEVRVVTAPPYYPAWKVGAGYRATRYTREEWRGCLVWRCPLWVPSRPSGLKRLVHLASFAVSSIPAVARQLLWRPDVVWVVEPALFCAPAAWVTARLCGARAWLHIQDLEIDAGFELGLMKGRLFRRMAMGLETWLLRRFDRVSTISLRMMERTRTKGVRGDRLELFLNWAHPVSAVSTKGAGPFRQELGIAPDEVVCLYSGTMGAKQGLELLAQAAGRLRDCPRIRFVFCGEGPGRRDLEADCADLPRVIFLDLQPVERIDALLTLADIHLLPQRPEAADLVMPSKLTGMLASGRPVVATCAEGTELAAVLHDRGLAVAPGDVVSLVKAIRMLADDPELRAQLGADGRRYAEEKLFRDLILGRFEQALKELIGHKR